MFDAITNLWLAPWFPAANVAAAALLLVWPARESASRPPCVQAAGGWLRAAYATARRSAPRVVAPRDGRQDVLASLVALRHAAAQRGAFATADERAAAFEQLDEFDALVDRLLGPGPGTARLAEAREA